MSFVPGAGRSTQVGHDGSVILDPVRTDALPKSHSSAIDPRKSPNPPRRAHVIGMSPNGGKLFPIRRTLLHALFLSQIARPEVRLAIDKARRLFDATERDPPGRRGDRSIPTLSSGSDRRPIGPPEPGDVISRRSRAGGFRNSGSPERVTTGQGGDSDVIPVPCSFLQDPGVGPAGEGLVLVHVGLEDGAGVGRTEMRKRVST